MSTICKIALTAPAEQTTEVLEDFLRDRDLRFDATNTEWPAACDRDNFNIAEEVPSILSIKQVTPEVTEIHFNSFGKVEDLASFLSSKTAARVVVNSYQSVSTASYWAFHADGKLVRSIEAGDAEVYAQSGERLPFEHEEPGRPAGDDGEQFMVFDYPEQDRYNQQVGVPVEVYQQYASSWKNFLLASHLYEPRSERSPKPWWRFW